MKLLLSDSSEHCRFPENLQNLRSLKFINGGESAISQLLSSVTGLNQLEELSFPGCRSLVLPPLSSLSNLTELHLSDCEIVEIPQGIGLLSSLQRLNLRKNNFENLPTSMKQLSQLRFLYLNDCNMLQSLPEFPPRLEFLEAQNCLQLRSLPELPECLENLDAFVLETLTQRSHTFSLAVIEFIFSNCPKLNEEANKILADSHIRIQHMVMASLSRFYEKEFNAPPGINICLPGNGIPKWFSNRSLGCSITIQLPQHCCNGNFIGFALFAVIGKEEYSNASGQFFQVACSYHFETQKEHSDMIICYLSNGIYLESDHVVLGFDPCWNVRVPEPDGDNHTTVSFEFSLDYHYYGIKRHFKVKCRGVCPLYAHLKDAQPNTFTVNMQSPGEEECTQIMKLHTKLQSEANMSGTTENIRRLDQEEVEQDPKTICKGIFVPPL